jgi:hypothetical protein
MIRFLGEASLRALWARPAEARPRRHAAPGSRPSASLSCPAKAQFI